MLMYGLARNIPTTDDLVVFNISGFAQIGIPLDVLIPPNSLGVTSSKEFDLNYYNWIMNNDALFVEFFRIIQALYTGKKVYLVSGDYDWAENTTESILKLIQQRYGYNGVYINSDDDFIMLSQYEYKFSKYGLANLDYDKNRYSYLVNRMELQTPGLKVRYE